MICEDGHDEIVYEGGRKSPCPLCEAEDKIKDIEMELNHVQIELEELQKKHA